MSAVDGLDRQDLLLIRIIHDREVLAGLIECGADMTRKNVSERTSISDRQTQRSCKNIPNRY